MSLAAGSMMQHSTYCAERGAGSPETRASFGQGCTAHLRWEMLPSGTAVLQPGYTASDPIACKACAHSGSLHSVCHTDGSALCRQHHAGLAKLSWAVPELFVFQLFSNKLGTVRHVLCRGVLRLNPSKLEVLLKGGHVSPIYIF